MAAGRIVLSQYFPARDRNGALVAGAKLFVYQNRTTTKAAIYSNAALTTPMANPVVANSSGQFPSIWASDAVTYTLSITGPAGTSIGNPSVFDDFSVSVDAMTESVALAESAAEAAEALYQDALAIEASGSNAAAIAARAAKGANLSDLTSAAAARDNLVLSPTELVAKTDKTGATDTAAYINALIATVQANGGGKVILPAGTYKTSGFIVPQQTYGGSGFGAQNRVIISGEAGTILTPTGNNVTIISLFDQFTVLENITIDNPAGYTGCRGIFVGPANPAQTTTRTFTNYNRAAGFRIYGMADGIVLRAGPTVGGASSPCYYNNFEEGVIAYSQRGIHIQDGVVGSHGANRNTFSRIAIGPFVNTGVHNEAGDTNTYQTVHFEGVNSGTVPSATPTAVKVPISGPTTGWENFNLLFAGCTAEACTRDGDTNQDDIQFIGCGMDFRDKWVYGQVPVYRLGKPYGGDSYIAHNDAIGYARYSTGDRGGFGSYFGNESTPANTLDVRNTAGGAIAQVRCDSGGEAKITVDTATGYGGFEMRNAADLSWYLGTQATNNRRPTFFNYLNTAVWQIAGDNDNAWRPVTDNVYNIGDASHRIGQLFAGTATISTSDASLKHWLGDLDDAELRAAGRIAKRFGKYQWLDALEEKGEAARWHFGVLAQEVEADLIAEGLDAKRYGFLCFDTWEEEVLEHEALYETPPPAEDFVAVLRRERGDDGEERVIEAQKKILVQQEPVLVRDAFQEVIPGGARYGIRYEELIAFLMAAQEQRLAALEA